jgi:hypothetical protein
MTKRGVNGVSVKRGQTYRVPRPGKVAVHVRVARVTKGQQPKAFLYRVTRSGKRVGPQRIVASVKLENNELKKTYAANTVPHWLTWRDGAWRLPASWILV